MLLLGRSTAQWGALYIALISFIGLALPTIMPGTDLTGINTLLVGSVALVGTFLAFLANQALTPVSDPRLAVGSVVNAGLANEAMVVLKNQ
jgi:ABC-type cobalamin transport system permease subunit